MNTFYDDALYSMRTDSLKKLAEAENALQKIAKVDATIYSVGGELIPDERTAYICAIELNRRSKQRKGGAKC